MVKTSDKLTHVPGVRLKTAQKFPYNPYILQYQNVFNIQELQEHIIPKCCDAHVLLSLVYTKRERGGF